MKIVIGLLIAVVLLNTAAFCDDEPGSISGKLIDYNTREIVTSVSVALSNKSAKLFAKTESDISGNYIIKNLPDGLYEINITRLGYINQKIEFLLSVGENKILDIYLNPVSIETEKINVTATRTEQTLQKTPSSVSVINSEDIDRKSKITFDQVLENIQGVTINRTSGINVSALSIRGSSDVAGGGIGNRVLLLLDGRPSLTGDSKGALWSLIPVSIIERTEVVKGAFSSLYGSSAIGGVVNVITKKPTYNSFTSINMFGGFYEQLTDSLRYSNKLLTLKGMNLLHSNSFRKFSYLLNFDYKQSDGYAQQTEYQFYSGIGKFIYGLFSDRDLELTLQYTNSRSGFPHYWRQDPGKHPEPYKVNPYYLGDKIYKETQSIDISYKVIPNSKSKYSSRFYYYKLSSISEYNPLNPVSLQYGVPGSSFETYIDSYNFGNISQADYNINNHYLIGGIDLQWNVVRSSPESILYGSQQQYNLGVYAQDQWDIIFDSNKNPVFASTIGIRFDYNKFIGSFEENQISPKLSFIYSPVLESPILKNTTLRFLMGKAFRAPSIAELYFKKELFGGFDFIYNPNLKPEEMVSFEFGVRKQFEERFSLDIALFYNLYDNLIQYVNVGNTAIGPFQVQNVAKAQIRGFEFGFEYGSMLKIFSDKFKYDFQFDYSLIDAKDISVNRKDDYLPYKPRHIFNAAVNLNYYGFNLNISGKYQSEVDEVLFFKYEEPEEYFIANAKLSKDISSRISVYIAVNNIFNKFYQELERIPAPNRNFNAGFNIDF